MSNLRCTVLLLMLFLTGCAQPPPVQPDPNIPFSLIAQGSDSGITLQKFLTIQSPGEFSELWRVHDRGRNPLPKIDFGSHMVLGIFLGQQHTGGYAVEVRNIETIKQQINVHVTVKTPAPASQRSMALTQPYTLVSLPRSGLKINYRVTQVQ